jgi:hypothetical protein
MHSLLPISMHAMERESMHDITHDTTAHNYKATFDAAQQCTRTHNSRSIKIPLTDICSDIGTDHIQRYIICALKKDIPDIRKNHMRLKDQRTITCDILFKKLQDIRDFKRVYKMETIQAQTEKLWHFKQQLISTYWYTHEFCIYTKDFFKTRSLWGNITHEKILFFQEVARCFNTDQLTNFSHILVISGRRKLKGPAYYLAIPLEISMHDKRITYEEFTNLYTLDSKKTHEKILKDLQVNRFSSCPISVAIEDSNGDLHKLQLPLHFYGTPSDIGRILAKYGYTHHPDATQPSLEKLKELLVLYESKKEEKWWDYLASPNGKQPSDKRQHAYNEQQKEKFPDLIEEFHAQRKLTEEVKKWHDFGEQRRKNEEERSGQFTLNPAPGPTPDLNLNDMIQRTVDKGINMIGNVLIGFMNVLLPKIRDNN